MSETSLEDTIRDEAEALIRDMAQKEAEDIRALDQAHAAEMEEFSARVRAETDERIRLEASRIENRAALELKKLKIRSIESFIEDAVGDEVKTIGGRPGYRRFLLDSVTGSLGLISAGSEIHLKRDDMALEGEIREALDSAGLSGDVIFREDGRIKWGGCMIIDSSDGRVFDSTIERIYFRRSLLIRQEAMRLIGESPGDEAKESSCRTR